jgi:hypothetical protein
VKQFSTLFADPADGMRIPSLSCPSSVFARTIAASIGATISTEAFQGMVSIHLSLPPQPLNYKPFPFKHSSTLPSPIPPPYQPIQQSPQVYQPPELQFLQQTQHVQTQQTHQAEQTQQTQQAQQAQHIPQQRYTELLPGEYTNVTTQDIKHQELKLALMRASYGLNCVEVKFRPYTSEHFYHKIKLHMKSIDLLRYFPPKFFNF